MSIKRVLFIVSEDWYFVSHRFHLAKSAISLGYSVALLSNYSKHRNEIEVAGIEVINWSINRSSKNPFQEMEAIKNIVLAIKHFKPSLIHSVAIKPVIHSAIACMISGIKPRIFALAGLGYIFTSSKKSAKLLRPFLKIIFKLLFYGKKTCLILQNPDDKSVLFSANVIKNNQIHLILGAGVDAMAFKYQKILKDRMPVIILSARMLWAKGIQDFIDSAKQINNNNINARFVLVGTPDNQNPDAIPNEKLEKWHKSGLIEWWGHQNDMAKIYHQSSIVCLPTTYGEGLPKSLLEAASCGRPIVTYDVPGCREIVKDGYNGYLVMPKSVDGLVQAISHLLNNYDLCVKMGKNGRKLVEKHFTQEKIAQETIAVWEEVLAS